MLRPSLFQEDCFPEDFKALMRFPHGRHVPSSEGWRSGHQRLDDRVPQYSGAGNQACSSAGTVWTCGFTKPGGDQALAVWDTAQSCSKGSCGGSTFKVPSTANYLHYRDFSGQVNTISGATVWIGYKPILLENQ